MATFHKEDSLYSKVEANICLNCKLKKCTGTCERLRQEKRKLKNTETCVVCGEVIPEGRQVCPNCERR